MDVVQVNRAPVGYEPLPGINYGTASSTSSVNPFETISQVLHQTSRDIENRLDVQAKLAGAKAGLLAGQSGLPDMMDEATIRGEAFNIAARDAMKTRFDVESIKNLNAYEQDHMSDPKGFESKARAYFNGVYSQLESKYPDIAANFKTDFELRAETTLNRVKKRQMVAAKDSETETHLLAQQGYQDELQGMAQQLFAPNATPDQNIQALNRMIRTSAKIADSAHAIGPDGQFLFSAAQRVQFQKTAEDGVAKNIGLAWFSAQPDQIAAYHDWRQGNVRVSIPDEKGGTHDVSLKELLGPTAYAKAADSFMENLRSSLALDAQIAAKEDRDLNTSSDINFAWLSAGLQDGSLHLQDVEDAWHSNALKADRYVTLRALAKQGGATISDGPTISNLVVRDAAGEDIRPLLSTALDNGMISRDDYIKFYGQNTTRLESGSKDPVVAARDSLMQRLGTLSKELGLEQSSAVGQASIAFETSISDFIQKNGRKPTIRETAQISEDVYQQYAAIDAKTVLIALPLPRSMTQVEKIDTRLNSATIEKKIADLTEKAKSQYGGDLEKIRSDPEYVQEITLLKKYYDLFKLKESGNARDVTGPNKQ